MRKQINHISRKAYSNTNHEKLENAAIGREFKSNEWMTFKQAHQVNMSVKKGEHGIPLMRLVRMLDKKTKKYVPRPVFFRVFNLDQVEAIAKEQETSI